MPTSNNPSQKFGNTKVTKTISGLGHEGKYTPSASSVPNLAHKFVNLSLNSEQNLLSASNNILLPKTMNDQLQMARQQNMNNNSLGNYVDIDTIDQILRSQESHWKRYESPRDDLGSFLGDSHAPSSFSDPQNNLPQQMSILG